MHSGIILIIALVVLIAAAVSYFSLHSTAPNVTSSIAQKYCYFNGTTYYSSNRIISGNFTVVAHVNFLSPGVLISQGIGNNSHAEWYLGIGGETGGKLGFGVFSNASTGSGTTFGWRFATANVMYNKWYYVAGVYNTTNVSLYVNGSMMASTPTPYAPINGSHVIFIGRRTSAFYVNGISTFEYFNGYADDIEIFNSSLSSRQLSELYNGTLSTHPTFEYCSVFFTGHDS